MQHPCPLIHPCCTANQGVNQTAYVHNVDTLVIIYQRYSVIFARPLIRVCITFTIFNAYEMQAFVEREYDPTAHWCYFHAESIDEIW